MKKITSFTAWLLIFTYIFSAMPMLPSMGTEAYSSRGHAETFLDIDEKDDEDLPEDESEDDIDSDTDEESSGEKPDGSSEPDEDDSSTNSDDENATKPEDEKKEDDELTEDDNDEEGEPSEEGEDENKEEDEEDIEEDEEETELPEEEEGEAELEDAEDIILEMIPEDTGRRVLSYGLEATGGYDDRVIYSADKLSGDDLFRLVIYSYEENGQTIEDAIAIEDYPVDAYFDPQDGAAGLLKGTAGADTFDHAGIAYTGMQSATLVGEGEGFYFADVGSAASRLHALDTATYNSGIVITSADHLAQLNSWQGGRPNMGDAVYGLFPQSLSVTIPGVGGAYRLDVANAGTAGGGIYWAPSSAISTFENNTTYTYVLQNASLASGSITFSITVDVSDGAPAMLMMAQNAPACRVATYTFVSKPDASHDQFVVYDISNLPSDDGMPFYLRVHSYYNQHGNLVQNMPFVAMDYEVNMYFNPTDTGEFGTGFMSAELGSDSFIYNGIQFEIPDTATESGPKKGLYFAVVGDTNSRLGRLTSASTPATVTITSADHLAQLNRTGGIPIKAMLSMRSSHNPSPL